MGCVAGPDSLGELLRRAAADGPWSPHDAREAFGHVETDAVTDAFGSIGVDLAGRAGERLEFFGRVAALCPVVQLDVAGHEVAANITDIELWRFYLPTCQALVSMAASAHRRLLVGVTGAPGSGKSVFAVLLREVMNRALSDRAMAAALCPLDGFHYPNAYLDSHFTTDEQGERIPLRVLKGLPETFDVQSFLDCLARVKDEPSVTVPRYDRRLHDSVEDGLRICPEDQVVLVEGNFLLLDRGLWAGVADLLDLSLFLVQPLEVVREAIIGRHILGGRSQEDALAHFEQVDRGNFGLCMATAARADLLVRRDAGQHIVSIEATGLGAGRVS